LFEEKWIVGSKKKKKHKTKQNKEKGLFFHWVSTFFLPSNLDKILSISFEMKRDYIVKILFFGRDIVQSVMSFKILNKVTLNTFLDL
jgi:hypothetical protein